jgi:hypothetical protein
VLATKLPHLPDTLAGVVRSNAVFQDLEKAPGNSLWRVARHPRLGKFSAKFLVARFAPSNPWKNHRFHFPILGTLCAVVCFAALAQAGEFKLPAGVYPLREFAAAKEEAAKAGKGVAFVLSELKGKSAKLATPNTNYAFERLKGVAVPVYVDYTDDLKSLPEKHPMVAKALRSDQAGKTIPRVAVLTPDCARVLAVVSTMPIGPMGDGVYEDACKQVQDYLKSPDKQVHLDAAKKDRGKGRKK